MTDQGVSLSAARVIIAMPPPLAQKIIFDPPLATVNKELAAQRAMLAERMTPGAKVKGNTVSIQVCLANQVLIVQLCSCLGMQLTCQSRRPSGARKAILERAARPTR